MMTLTEFIDLNAGQYVNYDTVYGPQCMDLYRAYVRDEQKQALYQLFYVRKFGDKNESFKNSGYLYFSPSSGWV